MSTEQHRVITRSDLVCGLDVQGAIVRALTWIADEVGRQLPHHAGADHRADIAAAVLLNCPAVFAAILKIKLDIADGNAADLVSSALAELRQSDPALLDWSHDHEIRAHRANPSGFPFAIDAWRRSCVKGRREHAR